MARTSSLGYAYADSTSLEVVLDRLRKNTIEKLAITASPFPTNLKAFIKALSANSSVRCIKFTAPAALEEQLETDEVREFYLRTLGGLPNLEEIVFHGSWKDIYVTNLLQAMDPSRKYKLQFWYLRASWHITSSSALEGLVNAVERLQFEYVGLKWIQRKRKNLDVTPLIQAIAMRSESMGVPLLSIHSKKASGGDADSRKVLVGALQSEWLDFILYLDSDDMIGADGNFHNPNPVSRVHRLRIGSRKNLRQELCQASYLENLAPFEGTRQSHVQDIDIYVMDSVTNFEPLLSFCRRAPSLTRLNVHLCENGGAIQLAERHPSVAKAIDFELCLNASGIRLMLIARKFSKKQWIDILLEKQDNLSILYYMLQQKPCMLAQEIE